MGTALGRCAGRHGDPGSLSPAGRHYSDHRPQLSITQRLDQAHHRVPNCRTRKEIGRENGKEKMSAFFLHWCAAQLKTSSTAVPATPKWDPGARPEPRAGGSADRL